MPLFFGTRFFPWQFKVFCYHKFVTCCDVASLDEKYITSIYYCFYSYFKSRHAQPDNGRAILFAKSSKRPSDKLTAQCLND